MSNKEHDKAIEIIVNGRPKQVGGREVTFDQIVGLAFDSPAQGAQTIYTVTYRKGGNEEHAEGIMVEGDTIKVKKGTTFNVTATNRS